MLERSEALRAWFGRLLAAWREAWACAPESTRARVRNSLCYLGVPVQAWIYVRAGGDVPVEAHAVVIRHAPTEPDGDVRVRFLGTDRDTELDGFIDSLVVPFLESHWANMRANWSPDREQGPPLQPWQIEQLDLGVDACLWFVPADLTAVDVARWVEFTFREPAPPSIPPREPPAVTGRRHLYEAGQDRERLAVMRWLSVGADHLLAVLGLAGPAWCALNVPRSEVFEDGADGDVDLLAGPIEFDITDSEWDKRFQSEARHWPLATHRSRIIEMALLRACEESRMVWPPRMETVVACEAKASWFEPEAGHLKVTHAGEARRVQGQLRLLLDRGVDRVAFLHVGATKPREGTDINLWFQASIDAGDAQAALDQLDLLFTPADLPSCGYFRTVLGAVCVDFEDRSGAGGLVKTLSPVSPNPAAATASREWRDRLRQRLAACGPVPTPRVFITCCARCGRWTASGLPTERCLCNS